MENKYKKDNTKKEARMKDFWINFWGLLKPSQKQIKVIFVMTIFVELFVLLGPYILKLIIDRLTQFNPAEINIIIYLIVAMFVVDLIAHLIYNIKDRKIFRVLIDIDNYLSVRTQKKLVFLPLSYHEKENTGNKLSKIERGIQQIDALISNLSWDVVPTLIQLVLTLVVLFVIDYRFGVSFLFFAPMFIWLSFKSNIVVRPLRKRKYKDYEKASGIMGQSVININTVKSFVKEEKEVGDYRKIKDRLKKNEIFEWMKIMNFAFGRGVMVDLGRVFILLFGVYLVVQGGVTIGTLVFAITLSEKAYFSMYRLSRIYDRIEEGREAVERFMRLNNEKSSIKNPVNGLKPETLKGDIRFENVSFSYSKDKNKALNNLTLKINEGCVTALVGPSGGGKTTVARMIYRHYDPESGSVSIDGTDIREYDLYSFRKFIAIVPQEVEIFSTSILNNISYSNSRASKEEIVAAAKIANAHEFVEKLPKGYDTEVGERGVKLSGGQRQRVGIARAILANPKILIFDEATSNLDSQSERLIQDAMDRISKGKTVIIIAHRLSTIKKADKIVVLEEGRIIEEGSHFELSKNSGGLYSKLIKLQELGELE